MSAQSDVHDALAGYLNDGEIAIAWTVTIDVAGPDGRRYLAHRAGGGHDGQSAPMAWTALGMLQASTDLARQTTPRPDARRPRRRIALRADHHATYNSSMDTDPVDNPSTSALHFPPSAVPGPHIPGQRAIAHKPELRPHPSPGRIETLLQQAADQGIDLTGDMAAIERRLAAMQTKIAVPGPGRLRIA